MNHSKKYEWIKKRYNKGYVRIDQLHEYVEHGAITPEEFEEISGQPYEVGEE